MADVTTSPPPATVVPPSPRPSPLKAAAKATAHALATVAVLPWSLAFWFGSAVLGRDRAIEGATQALAPLPGLIGVYLRRAFLVQALTSCHRTAVVEYGTLFSQADCVLEENVYVGPGCHLGLVHLKKDVLVAAGVHIPSGGRTHYFDDPTRPIREQGGERSMVTVGEGAWIGSAAVILADVGRGTVVGAGSVVTKPLPDYVLAAGVPARVIRSRFVEPPPGDQN